MHFSFNFGLIPFLMFASVFALIIGIIVKNISEEAKNSKAPVQTVSARIVSKRIDSHSTGSTMTALSDGMMSGTPTGSTQHYVTFEAPDGSRLELRVQGSEYGMLAEGDYGELTFQRKRYIGFNRQATPEQMLYAQQIQEQQRLNQAMQEQMRYGQTLPQDTPQNFIQTNDWDQRAQF